MSVTVHHGDCLDVLRGMGEASVDSVVTDPPYGLGFMGRGWDHGVPGVPFWAEVLRVMKPGAHLVAFGGTRTYHRMVCAIEDAGFEIRDQLAWLYGSGFPKSHDIGKAIDRARNDDPAWKVVGAWLKARRVGAGMSAKNVCAAIGTHGAANHGGAVSNWENGFSCPTWDQWLALKALLGFGDEMDAKVWRLNGRKGQPGEAWLNAETLAVDRRFNEPSGIVNIGQGERTEVDRLIKAPATDAAKQWQGWGTALKPAHEPIVLARKPLACPTVAAQVLATGTGALNIDATRIPADWDADPNARGWQGGNSHHAGAVDFGAGGKDRVAQPNAAGRWPANLVHDGSPEVLAAFAAFGERQSRPGATKMRGESRHCYGQATITDGPRHDDTGTAARFFYSAKASKAERAGSRHPTIKPLALMRWLCRLVTPPGGTVLDCFAGTGVTGEAALLEGFGAVLVEREAEHVADIRSRLGRARGDDAPLFAESAA